MDLIGVVGGYQAQVVSALLAVFEIGAIPIVHQFLEVGHSLWVLL
jgi:hypothetical protein